MAESPLQLRNDLARAARAGLAAIEQFQSSWRGPELKPIWAHVEARMRESNGQFLQPTGMWEKDYDVLLSELREAERTTVAERQREEEEAQRAKVQSAEGEQQAVVERFIQSDIPGVRVIKGSKDAAIVLALARAGMVFQVDDVKEPHGGAVSEWQVSSKVPAGRVPTKLEQAILDCLRARPRKWDLAFLLV